MREFGAHKEILCQRDFCLGARRPLALLLAGLCALMLVVSGCIGSARTQQNGSDADCVKQSMREVLLRWGEWNDTTKVLTGYELDAKGRLYRTQAAEFSERYLRDSIAQVPVPVFCMYADTTKATFLKIQSLTVRAPIMRYVEYQNPPARITLRAVWDKRFQTHGSREFRAIFDSLSTFIPHHTP
jgi:hypothetical protein